MPVPLRMALWERDREGQPAVPGEEILPSIGSVGDAYDCETVDCHQAA